MVATVCLCLYWVVEFSETYVGNYSTQQERLNIYGLRHHTACSGHHNHYPAKRSGPESLRVSTESRYASPWPVFFKECRLCRATGVANIGTRLVPQRDT